VKARTLGSSAFVLEEVQDLLAVEQSLELVIDCSSLIRLEFCRHSQVRSPRTIDRVQENDLAGLAYGTTSSRTAQSKQACSFQGGSGKSLVLNPSLFTCMDGMMTEAHLITCKPHDTW
jgi:hypothetical protein